MPGCGSETGQRERRGVCETERSGRGFGPGLMRRAARLSVMELTVFSVCIKEYRVGEKGGDGSSCPWRPVLSSGLRSTSSIKGCFDKLRLTSGV